MKTIFFSLSFNNVFKNLFFFKGSLFFKLKEALAQRKDLKVVFILPRGYDKKYEQFIRDNFSGNYDIEIVSHTKIKNFWQKLFYFFYAHLIFTKTTKMLTTMGMRPGEPPGGGRRYLAPIKFLIARTFGKLKILKNRTIPYLFWRLFAKGLFDAIFEKYNPDLVFVGHIFGRFDQALMAEAKRRKVLTLGMISNWDHFDKYYIPVQVDRLLAQSEQVKEFGIKYQNYKPEQISIVGYPQFDFLVNQDYIISRQELFYRFNFPWESKFVFYISGSAYCPDEPDIIEKILQWSDEGKFNSDVRVVIRPYLSGRGADEDFDMQKYNRFKSHPKVVYYEEFLENDAEKSAFYFNIMRHADAVIGVYTTSIMESAVLDRPDIVINFDGYKNRPFIRSIKRFGMREHFYDILGSGGVKITNNFDELFEAMNNYLKNPELDRDKRKKLCEKVCYKIDGMSSERILKEIFKNAGLD